MVLTHKNPKSLLYIVVAQAKSALLIILILIFTVLKISFPISAASNDTYNFQGRIVGKDGHKVSNNSPVCVNSGQDSCAFRVGYYDAITGGTLLWQEDFLNKELGDYDGIFNLSLGSGTKTAGSETLYQTVFTSRASVYMQVFFDPTGNGTFVAPEVFTVDGTNRLLMQAVPYAFRANVADQISSSNTQFIKNQTSQQTGASFSIDGSGTVGGTLNVNSHQLFVDATSGNVGIGATIPGQKLTIDGTFGILEGGSTPSYHTIFQGGDQAGDLTYTLPTTAGNGVLTNASGILSWSTPAIGTVTQVGSMTSATPFSDASASADWLGLGASGGRIYFDDQTVDGVSILNANVGIGTSTFDCTNPEKLLVAAGTTTSFNAISATGSINNYFQINIKNASNGTGASSDLVATADNGSETTNFINMGINSSAYTAGIVGNANDAYLYSTGNNLLIGNGTTAKDLIFFTNGTNAYANEIMRLTSDKKVGIGTTTPNAQLDVVGTGSFTSPGVTTITGSIDPTASTTVTGVGTKFLTEVKIGDRISLNGTGVITGSINPTASTAVVGVGTLFLTELKLGDQITVNGETRMVVDINSNTSLSVSDAFSDTANDTSVDRISLDFRTVIAIASDTSLTVNAAFIDNGNDTSVNVYHETLDVYGGVFFRGGATFQGLDTPSAPTVTPIGTTGAVTWRYKVSAMNANGNESIVSATGTTTSGNANLTGSNFNRITWSAVEGAAAYRIYRTTVGTSPTTTGYIGRVEANDTLSFDDTGNGAIGGVPATVFNESSNVSIGTTNNTPRDTLTVDGRINESWRHFYTDFFGARANITTSALMAFDGLAWGEVSVCTGSFPSVANGVLRQVTGATSGNGCQVSIGTSGTPNVKQIDVSLNPVLEVIVNPGANTNTTAIVGFTNTSSLSVAEPTNGVYFYSSTAGTPTNQWIATSRAASTSTTIATAVSTNANAYQKLRIEVTATSARYFINDLLVAEIGTNIPAAGSILAPFVGHSTTDAVSKTMDIDSIEFWQDDPEVTGAQGQLPVGFNAGSTAGVLNPNLYVGTEYVDGAATESIPAGFVVSSGNTQEFDADGLNRIVYDIQKSKVNDSTILGIASGLKDPLSDFDAYSNPYAVASSGTSYAWVEEGNGANISLGEQLSLSINSAGYLANNGSQLLVKALEAVDWSTVTDTVNGRRVKLVKVNVNGVKQKIDYLSKLGTNLDSTKSYLGEEFNAFKTTRTNAADYSSNQANSFGDNKGWGVYSNTNNNTFSTPNGVLRQQVTATSTGSLVMMDETAGVAHNTVSVANQPTLLMKVKPGTVGANNVLFVGASNATDGSLSAPANSIGFTNYDNETATGTSTWYGRVSNNGLVSQVVCTGQSISSSASALLMVEVKSATDVRFFVDNDVTNGIDLNYCGNVTNNIPTGLLAPQLIYQVRAGGTNTDSYLDTDFVRIWQNDSASQVVATSDAPVSSALETRVNADGSLVIGANDGSFDLITFRLDGKIGVNADIETSGGISASCVGLSGTNDCNGSIASKYTANEQVEAGDLVSLIGGQAVSKSTTGYDDRMLGVVVSAPGITLGENKVAINQGQDDGLNPAVAFGGVVFMKVSGQIAKGDYLTSSTIPGVAMKVLKPGYAVAQALEDFNSNTVGNIKAVIKVGFVDPVNALENLQSRLNDLQGQIAGINNTGLSSTDQAALASLQSKWGIAVGDDDNALNLGAFLNGISFNEQAGALDVNTLQDPLLAGALVFNGTTNFFGITIFDNTIISDQNSAGRAVIKAGDNVIDILFTKDLPYDPVVNLTARGVINSNFYVTNETVKGFSIVLATPLSQDVEFNWSVFVIRPTGTPILTPTP